MAAKVIFITDADSPSGTSLLLAFAEEEAALVLNSPSGGSAIAEELEKAKQLGAKLFIACADLTDSQAVALLLDEAERAVGPIDVLIHNHDEYLPALTETCDEQSYFTVMNANAKTAFICTQEAGRRMSERETGAILYLSSIHAEKPTGSSFAYSASKGAIQMLAKEASLYFGRSGVRVNTVLMGPVDGHQTRFKSGLSSLYDHYAYKVPRGRLGSFEDAAKLAIFLSSEDADYVNGADIRLDGGFLLHYMDHKMKRSRPGDES